MAAPLSPPRLLPSGDSAITVEFSRKIDDEANRRVLALDRTLAREPIAGVSETIPTYRSLLVHYDPTQVDFATLGKKLVELAQRPVPALEKSRLWRISCIRRGVRIRGCSRRQAPSRSVVYRPGFNASPVRAAGICWVARRYGPI